MRFRLIGTLALGILCTDTFACNEPDYVPFSGDVKIVCSIDWKVGSSRESTFFAPLGRDNWVAWVDAGIYSVEAVSMIATNNSCTGLALVGRKDGFLYRIFIDADSSTILANLEHDDPGRADEGFGDCKVLDEETHEIVISRKDDAE